MSGGGGLGHIEPMPWLQGHPRADLVPTDVNGTNDGGGPCERRLWRVLCMLGLGVVTVTGGPCGVVVGGGRVVDAAAAGEGPPRHAAGGVVVWGRGVERRNEVGESIGFAEVSAARVRAPGGVERGGRGAPGRERPGSCAAAGLVEGGGGVAGVAACGGGGMRRSQAGGVGGAGGHAAARPAAAGSAGVACVASGAAGGGADASGGHEKFGDVAALPLGAAGGIRRGEDVGRGESASSGQGGGV